MSHSIRRPSAFTAFALLVIAASIAPAPQALAQADEATTTAKTDLYDESADARDQIAAALAKAAPENRRVLIQWGFENCSWCHLLHKLCTSDLQIKTKLSYEYELVFIDIGNFDKNMDLAASYGAEVKTGRAPFLTVLDAAGEPVANQETGSLEASIDPPAHDPAKVLAFLTEHQAPYWSADEVLSRGLAQASAEGKKVFLHFGAPWCIWCHRLEDWLARPDVAPTFARSFLPVKIDQDRMTGAKQLLERFEPAGGGIPWTAILNADGTVVVTSDGPDGNIGFPAADAEIDYFRAMLGRAGVPKADGETLISSLKSKP